jgi:Zn-dependent M28 family amino/carboxypeptidase
MRDPSRAGEIHPGADDNASGSAAVLMLAAKLAQSYAALAEGESARSILFIGFDAEEAGLHGAFHYVSQPIAPLEDHALMINFDMIGRIVNKRLSVSGGRSALGMAEWLDPLFEASPLEIVTDAAIPGGSDHMAFMQRKVPYLFAIIADFHDEYHTPDDVTWKINREDAVAAIDLFHQIALTAAKRTAPFEWAGGQAARREPAVEAELQPAGRDG